MRIDKEYKPTKEQEKKVIETLINSDNFLSEEQLQEQTNIHPMTLTYILYLLDYNKMLVTRLIDDELFYSCEVRK